MTALYRRSSFCAGGACVEVAVTPHGVQVRATGQDDALDFTHDEWDAFIAGAKAGEFDRSASDAIAGGA